MKLKKDWIIKKSKIAEVTGEEAIWLRSHMGMTSLSREMIKALLPVFQHYADTGEFPKDMAKISKSLEKINGEAEERALAQLYLRNPEHIAFSCSPKTVARAKRYLRKHPDLSAIKKETA